MAVAGHPVLVTVPASRTSPDMHTVARLLTAVAIYVRCDVLWLLGGSMQGVPDALQPALKYPAFGIAVTVFVLMAAWLAVQGPRRWLVRVVAGSSVAAFGALALVTAISYVWFPGQFFHDSSGLDGMRNAGAMSLALVPAVVICSGLVGAAARLLRAMEVIPSRDSMTM